MLAIVLSTLFTAAALLAMATIVATLRRHGRAALALRGELAACSQVRDVDVMISEITVRASAIVLRPDFTAARRSALRAAA